MHRPATETLQAIALVALVTWSASLWAQTEQSPSSDAAEDPQMVVATEGESEPAEAAPPSDESGDPAQQTESASTVPTIPVDKEADAATDPEATRLEDVIVTATKRERSVRELPMSIDAFDGKDLVEKGATELENIVRLSPGLTKNGSRVVIRGIGTTALASFVTSEETGRFLGDTLLNAPSARGVTVDFDPYDMSTVEILKGPQGTLFGGTALAGIIRYVPTPPDIYGFAGSARYGMGTLEHSEDLQKELSFMLNGGFADMFGVRVVETQKHRAGVVDDLKNGIPDVDQREVEQTRVLARWRPVEDLSVDLMYLYYTDWGEFALATERDQEVTCCKTMPEPQNMMTRATSARVEYKFGDYSVVGAAHELETGMWWPLDLAPILGTSSTPGANTYALIDTFATVPSYEVRVLSNKPTEAPWAILSNWDYLIGVFYMTADQRANQKVTGTTGVPPFSVDEGADGRAEIQAEEQAVFCDLTKGIFDRLLEINVGGRYALTHLDVLTYTDQNGSRSNAQSQSTDDKRFNPKAALTWNPTKNISLRGALAQGFRFGGGNGNATADAEGVPRTFKSDELWHYEAGLRSEWFDRMLRFDVTGFRIDWDDLQIAQVTESGSGNFVSNVGGAKIRGAESQLLWRLPGDLALLPDGLTFSLGASYIDARITEGFESEDGYVPPGTRLPLTPFLLGNAALTWDGALGPALLRASITNAYSGPRKNQLINTVPLDAYNAMGAVLKLAIPHWVGAPALTISGNNLTDEIVPHWAFATVANPNEAVMVLNRPRSILVSLEGSF